MLRNNPHKSIQYFGIMLYVSTLCDAHSKQFAEENSAKCAISGYLIGMIRSLKSRAPNPGAVIKVLKSDRVTRQYAKNSNYSKNTGEENGVFGNEEGRTSIRGRKPLPEGIPADRSAISFKSGSARLRCSGSARRESEDRRLRSFRKLCSPFP